MEISAQRERRSGIVGPLVLIGLGLLFLFNNLGWLSWNIWADLLRLWPIWLIVAGLDLIIGRRSPVGAAVVVLVAVVLVGTGFWYLQSGRPSPGTALTGEVVEQPLGAAQRATVRISSGVSHLQISGGAVSSNLIDGTIRKSQSEQIDLSSATEGDLVRFELSSKGRAMMLPFIGDASQDSVWDLHLNQEIPLDLQVNTGVGESQLSLERLDLSALQVNTGVGKTVITLPRRGAFRADISGGIGEVVLRVPAELPVRLSLNTGLGSATVPDGFVIADGVYLSPGYDAAGQTVEVRVDGGIGAIRVEQILGE